MKRMVTLQLLGEAMTDIIRGNCDAEATVKKGIAGAGC
jgi:hypothetical protein